MVVLVLCETADGQRLLLAVRSHHSLAALARAVTRYVGRGFRGTWVEGFELRGSRPSSYMPRRLRASTC